MKENKVKSNYFFKGETNMKRTLVLVVLITAFVLSLTAVAGAARYDGFYAGTDRSGEAYLRWADAQAAWQRNTGAAPNTPEGDQGTAHGNYRTTTAKCFVCHSAHRAYAPAASTSLATAINNNRGLVDFGAGNSCITCHATAGATGATKQIEWGTMYGNVTDNGPHEDFGCTGRCHAGGIHGWGGSEFHGMNVYLLGGESDAEMRADFIAGNANSIMRRTNLTGMPGRANNTNVAQNTDPANLPYNVGEPMGQYATGNQFSNFEFWADGTTGWEGARDEWTFGPAWFQFGPDTPPANGMPPANLWNNTYFPETVFAAAKATATGYTCGRSGCHSSGNFAINTWGFGADRVEDP
ncbi:MAG: hypothetical protein FWD93_00135, partial [Coriobacteriia bacterium]|nr:hypothetical protein [Coriobacteriia bacterium]